MKNLMRGSAVFLALLPFLLFTGCMLSTGNEGGGSVSYTLSFDVNSGNDLEESVLTISAPPSVNLGTLPIPSHSGGKFFEGWYTDPSNGVRVSSSTPLSAIAWDQSNRATLYAGWANVDQVISYSISLNVNGGNTVSPNIITRTGPNDTTVGSLPSPTHASLIFAGWWTMMNGGTLITGDTLLDTITWTNNSITLYAHWTTRMITYTINFNANGGAVSPANKTVEAPEDSISSITLSTLPTPAKTNAVFMGWNTQIGGTGTRITAETPLDQVPWTNEAVTIYAIWRDGVTSITYTINFNSNGGTVSPISKTVTYPAVNRVGELPDPIKGNEYFSGWYTALSNGTKITANTDLGDVPWENNDTITLFAIWSDAGPGLALHYDFTAGTVANTVKDLVGINHGTLYGGASLDTLNGIGVLKTGAGNGYVDMGAAVGYLVTGQDEFTISVFVHTTNTVSGNGYDPWSMCNVADSATSSSNGKYVYLRTSGQFVGPSVSGWNNEKRTSAGENLSANTWRHYIYRQKDNEGRLYIDGVLAMTNTNVTVKPTDLAGLTYNYLARPCFSGNTYMLNSMLADFRIYSVAVSDEQILALRINDKLTLLRGSN
jgi:hypothetical protein